jgi:uncharacterized BrkB/YihY/UPF0761 family membrane protein
MHSSPAINAIYVAVRDYFAGTTGTDLVKALEASRKQVRHFEWVSVLMLLFTANGVFLPLEVALNRAWGITKSRNLLMNQLVSTLLILSCGLLVLLSAVLTGDARTAWEAIFGDASRPPDLLLRGIFKLASIPCSIIIVFLVYWKLPNAKVPWREVLPRAVVIGLLLEVLKWPNVVIARWLFEKFSREYSYLFRTAVTLLTWSFFAGLIVLAGADWSARRARQAEAREAVKTGESVPVRG